MRNILDRIDTGNKAMLKGDLTLTYSAVVILSADIKTEELPKGTALPTIMRYNVKPNTKWDNKMQDALINFIATLTNKAQAENKRVLIISDDGMTRPSGAVIRLLIRFGFVKKDAINVIRKKTGFAPDDKTMASFPNIDEKRFPVIAMKVFGRKNALIATKATIKQFGLDDDEIKLIPDVQNAEAEKVAEELLKPKSII